MGVHRSTNAYESFLVEILELVIGARLSLICFLQPFFIHFDMSTFVRTFILENFDNFNSKSSKFVNFCFCIQNPCSKWVQRIKFPVF